MPIRALRILVPALVALIALVAFLPKLLGLAAGPELEIITALKETERHGLKLEVPGSTTQLVAQRHHFDRVVVTRDDAGAFAVATLDFTGLFGETKVSSLGLERIPFEHREGDWEPASSAAPRLIRIVSALERRRRALEKGDLDALGRIAEAVAGAEEVLRVRDRRLAAKAWYIRSEREEVLVTEDYRLTGSLPDRPVDEIGSRRLTLIPRGEEFIFSGSVM